MVNHYGTLLSSVPLLNKNMKCLIVNEECLLSFTYLSIDSYLKMIEGDKDLLIASQLNRRNRSTLTTKSLKGGDFILKSPLPYVGGKERYFMKYYL